MYRYKNYQSPRQMRIASWITIISLLFVNAAIAPGALATPSSSPCIVEYTGSSTGRLLILLQGLNTTSSGYSQWQGLKNGLSDLYSGIVHFSYDENDPSGSYEKEDTGQSIWNHHIPILETLISNCRARPDGFTSVDLIGHSMGGVVALTYILQHGLNGPNAGYVRRVITLDSPVNGSRTLCSFNYPLSCYRPLIPSLGEAINFVLGNQANSVAGEEMGGQYLSRDTLIPNNVQFAKNLKRIAGIEVYTFTNAQDVIIPRSEAIIEGFGASASLGQLDLSLGHSLIFQSEHTATALSYIRPVLERSAEPNPNPTPETTTPPPQSGNDAASFISDVTLTDGTVVSPGQALQKRWLVKNTGTSTWTSGYKLVFVNGAPMGAPIEVPIPPLGPGQQGEIVVNLTAPTAPNIHRGDWRLRNPQGTFFGDPLWVEVEVRGSTGAGHITVFDVSPASPSNAASVHLVGRVRWFPEFRSMRFVAGNEYFEMSNFRQVGDQLEISTDWNTASLARGNYTLALEVATHGDPSWSNPERQIKPYTLNGTPALVNRPPNRPIPTSPYDWYVYYSGNTANLCAQHDGDPDGDAIAGYYFDIFDSAQSWNSGWTGSNCVNTSALGPYTYQWRVKVRDGSGAESGWSDSWHFTLVNPSLTISELYFQPQDASSEQIKIRTCTTGQGGIGITMRVSVNDANDGSASGNWHIVKEQGSPCFNEIDAPIWHTLEYGDGPHRVRSEAHGLQTGWDGAAVREETYTLPPRRPPAPQLVAPSTYDNNGTWWNEFAITFEWIEALRATGYQLRVSTSQDLWSDPAPLLNVALGSGVTSYTHNFAQDYGQLYWGLRASNSAGSADSRSGVWFGIDHAIPTCSIPVLPATTWESVFQVNWAGIDNSAGVRSYDIQVLDSGRGDWRDWQLLVPVSKTFSIFSGQPGHSYSFRCKATDKAGNTPPAWGSADTTIRIDPSALPPSPWWNGAYAFKRHLTILNNMPGLELPTGYPVHLHFDSGTNPTAAELYNASLTGTKCNDLRIVYNDTTELNRVVATCTGSAIDIWFRTQIAIPAASSNNTAHQLYIGNASAGAPLMDGNMVWYPFDEAGTTNLYFFQEGSGSTAYDYSGNNRHCSINATVQWAPAKFGNGLRYNRANSGASQSLLCGTVPALTAFTIELWYKADADDGGQIAAALSGGGNGGGGNNWRFEVVDNKLGFEVWPCGPCASFGVKSNFNFNDSQYAGRWNHIAVTFNGATEVKFYINGQLDSTKYMQLSGINTYSPPLEIGSAEGGGQLKGNMGALQISAGVKTRFPYAGFANIINEPTTAAGAPLTPPASGNPDLLVTGLDVFPYSEDGVLVQLVLKNQGTLNTQNGFFTDVYLNNVPTGPGYYTGTVQFWVNEPITAGAAVTLTTVLTDLSGMAGMAHQSFGAGAEGGFEETSGTLYAQVDTTGAVTEPDNQNNIYSAGADVCVATADEYESDDSAGSATAIGVGQSQTHNFSSQADEDWVQFAVQAGVTYTVNTSGLGLAADTYLYLYDTDGATLLVSNDDYGGSLASRITWAAPASGMYYVRATHWNPGTSGCATGYSLSLALGDGPGASSAQIYLPLVFQNASAAAPAQTYTVTVYSQLSDGELGAIYCATWSECRNSAASNFMVTTGGEGTFGADYEAATYHVKRLFLFFDTSSIPANAIIQSASLYVHGGIWLFGSTRLHVVQSTAGVPLTSGDFSQISFVSGGLVDVPYGQWAQIGLSALGRSWIAKGGTTKLALIHDLDLSNAVPVARNDALVWLAEDSARRPYLVLNYALP